MSAETRVALDGYTSNNSVKPKDYDIEMVFGTPNSTKTGQPDKPAVHMVANERRNDKTHNHNGHGTHDGAEPAPSQPLLEPDKEKPKPPLAGPEIDDIDDEPASPTAGAPYPGIDDGLLEGDSKPNEKGHDNGNDDDHNEHDSDDEHHILRGGGHETDDGNWWPTGDDVDTTDGVHLSPRFGDDRPTSPFPGSIPDVNTYQQKKNLAQGMMDLALLSANANQLRYVLESSSTHPYFYFSLVFISLSIILQIAVGIGLIMNSRYNVKDDKDICKADKINNFTVIGVFMITVVNVFITSFSVASNNPNGVVRSDSG